MQVLVTQQKLDTLLLVFKRYLTTLSSNEFILILRRWWTYDYGTLVEWYWPAKTEVLEEKPVPVSMSTINLTCTGLELNPSLCSERMVTDRLSHDTAAFFRRILDAAIRMKNNPNGQIRAVRCARDVQWGWRPMRATCCDTDMQWGWRWPFWWQCILDSWVETPCHYKLACPSSIALDNWIPRLCSISGVEWPHE